MRSGWENDERVPVDDGEERADFDETETPGMAAMRQFAVTVLEDDDPLLTLDCLVAMLGVLRVHNSMSDIARRHKVTRALVSKRCIQLGKRLGLPNVYGRSEATRERCRKSRLKATS